MPEPLTIATGVVSIVANCIKGLEIAKDYIDRYNSAELKIVVLATQCETIRQALLEVQNLLTSNKFPRTSSEDGDSENDLISRFNGVFGNCSIAFSILYERVKPLLSPSLREDNRMKVKSKIAAIWNNSDIDRLIDLIHKLVPAVHVLITAFQTLERPSCGHAKQMLN
jgi:hypothetical protein